MGAALHLAHVQDRPSPKRKRKGGGRDDGEPPFIIPAGSCEACREHWHHKCRGANLLDEHRPDCPCPCGDPADPTGQRISAAAWTDLAKHAPAEVWKAATLQSFREGQGVHLCAWRDDNSGLRGAR
jgi:hypothetical protein